MNKGLFGWPKGFPRLPYILGTPRQRQYRNYPVDADRQSAGFNATSGSLPFPPLTATGDLLIAWVRVWNTGTTISMSGWTQLAHFTHGAFGTHTIALFYRVADGTELGAGTGGAAAGFANISQVAAGGGTAAIMWCLQNAQAPPYVAGPSQGSGTVFPSPPITTGRTQLPHLFLALGSSLNGVNGQACPGYEKYIGRAQPGSGDLAGVWGCTKLAPIDSETPPNWITNFNGWDYMTIAVVGQSRAPSIQR